MRERRRARALAAVVVASVGLGGCLWPQSGQGPEQQRWNRHESTISPANAATLAPVWTATLGGSGARMEVEPVVRDGRVLAATTDEVSTDHRTWVRGVDLATGAVAWSTRIGVRPADHTAVQGLTVTDRGVQASWFHSLPGASLDCQGGRTWLDPADGRIVSEATSGDEVPASPVVVGDLVASTPATDAPGACNGGSAKNLRVTDLDGDVVWQRPGPVETNLTEPMVADGRVFVGDPGNLESFPLAGCGAPTCTATWESTASLAATELLGAEGHVFAASGRLASIDAATGAAEWMSPVGSFRSFTSLAYADGVVYVADRDRLSAFAADGCGAATCAPLWTAPLAAVPARAPELAVAGGVVAVVTGSGVSGTFQAFAGAGCGAATCAALATDSLGGFGTHVVAAGGRFVVGVDTTAQGAQLVAYAPADTPPLP